MNRPLDGCTIVVTRPAAQAGRFVASATADGATCIALPTLQIDRLPIPAAQLERVRAQPWDWVLYTSTNAVEHASTLSGGLPPAQHVAAVGRATARALERLGVTVELRPETANSEGLLATPELGAVGGQRVLLVKGEGGRDLLRETLTARGAHVESLEVYRRTTATPDPAALAALCASLDSTDVRLFVTATSAEVLEGLLRLVPEGVAHRLKDRPLLVPGARVAESARSLGWHGPVLHAATAEDEAMLAALRALAAGAQPAA